MLIHGKNVEFIVEKEIPTSLVMYDLFNKPYSSRSILSQLKRPRIKIPYLNELCESYLKQDIPNFLNYSAKMIIEIFVEELEKNPYFITSEHFRIKINLSFEGSAAKYHGRSSDLNNANFDINIVAIMRQALFFCQQNPNEVVHHELIHHLDMYFDKKVYQYIPKTFSRLIEREQDFLKKFYLLTSQSLIYIISKLRTEGIAEFATLYKKNKKIYFGLKPFADFEKAFNLICIYLDPEILNKVNIMLSISRAYYEFGSIIICTIVLNNLFKNNKKFSAWIELYHFILWRREYNATEIGEFYGIKDFKVYFTYDDKEATKIVEQTLHSLYGMNHIQFIKAYEEACKGLKVKPFFTLELYNYYKRKCWENYQILQRRGGI